MKMKKIKWNNAFSLGNRRSQPSGGFPSGTFNMPQMDLFSKNKSVVGRYVDDKLFKGQNVDYFGGEPISIIPEKHVYGHSEAINYSMRTVIEGDKKQKIRPMMFEQGLFDKDLQKEVMFRKNLKESIEDTGMGITDEQADQLRIRQILGEDYERVERDKQGENRKIFVDKKPVIFKTESNYPKVSILKDVYEKIDDDRKVPVVVQTKKQYLKEYIANQEKKKKVDFPETQEKEYLRRELDRMKPVVTRYTTKHNKYMEPRVVIFPDKKLNDRQLKESILHEYAHELWEKNPKIKKDWQSVNKDDSPTAYGRTDKEEDFADSYALYKTGRLKDEKRIKILKDVDSKNSEMPEFGSVEWQNEMLMLIRHKLERGEELTPQEESFLYVMKERADREADIDYESKEKIIFSVRPKEEKEAYPADVGFAKGYGGKIFNRMLGRHTGYFGTGIYGYDTEEGAKEDLMVKKGEGEIKRIDIKNPLIIKSRFDSQTLHDASKKLVEGVYGSKTRTDFWGGADLELERLGFDNVTEERLDAVREKAKETGEQPINIFLKEEGYTGVIPSKEFQNRSFGSVAFVKPGEKVEFIEEDDDSEEKKLLIPQYAKDKAEEALVLRKQLPESRKFGIDKQEADKLGINSGVERAKQIARNTHLSDSDTRRVAAFYQRFKNCTTPKCEGAIDLWGGRRFGQLAVAHILKDKESEDKNIETIKKAKEHFGITENPKEAGYILSDGTMLDFSGRHYAEEKNGEFVSKRNVDHREVFDVVGKGGNEGMNEFIKQTEAIRVMPQNKAIAISIEDWQKPTTQQIKTIDFMKNAIGAKEIYYDIYDEKGNIKKSGVKLKSSEILQDNDGEDAILYHGTSKEKYKKIKKEGLKPYENYWGKPAVFLTANKSVASLFGEKKGDGIVLKVDVPDNELINLGHGDWEEYRQHPFHQIRVYRKIEPESISKDAHPVIVARHKTTGKSVKFDPKEGGYDSISQVAMANPDLENFEWIWVDDNDEQTQIGYFQGDNNAS